MSAPKRVLMVGRLGYHEQNVVAPILHALTDRGALVVRAGGVLDFFTSSGRRDMPNALSGLHEASLWSVREWDVVFCVDWWNLSVPFLRYIAPGSKLCGVFHGGCKIEGDCANNVVAGKAYEAFLLDAYDEVYAHAPWLCRLYAGRKCRVLPVRHPYSQQVARSRPEWPWKPRIIYAHRWDDDKGKSRFVEFAAAVRKAGLTWELVVTDPRARDEVVEFGVRVTGWLSQNELSLLCREGGYAWASVKSEIAAYAVHDLLSYGLTPLVNVHPAYEHIPRQFKHVSIDEAIAVVQDARTLDNDQWGDMMREHVHNAARFAEAILA